VNVSASSLARKARGAALSGCEETLFGNVCWFGMTQDCTLLEGHPEIGAARISDFGIAHVPCSFPNGWLLASSRGLRLRTTGACLAVSLAIEFPCTMDQHDSDPAEDHHQRIACHSRKKIQQYRGS